MILGRCPYPCRCEASVRRANGFTFSDTAVSSGEGLDVFFSSFSFLEAAASLKGSGAVVTEINTEGRNG